MLFEPVAAPVRVEFIGEAVAESAETRVMYELGHAPVYYFPPQDVRKSLLVPSDHHSYCPYKGDASYWSVAVGAESLENAVWAYQDPYDEMEKLAGWMGFYWERFDWFENGAPVVAPREIDGRVNHLNNFAVLFPDLAADWHPQKNTGTRPYEFSADSKLKVWWKNVDNDEWRESIHSRVGRHRET